jgi:hypothetical protein
MRTPYQNLARFGKLGTVCGIKVILITAQSPLGHRRGRAAAPGVRLKKKRQKKS